MLDRIDPMDFGTVFLQCENPHALVAWYHIHIRLFYFSD